MHDSIELHPEPRAPGAARHFVADKLRDAVPAAVADVAVLLTSELVTNAVVHARSNLRVEVDVENHMLRVTVIDLAARLPRQRRDNDARLTGRGMNIVAALSYGWGVEPDPPGKKVWFELPA